MRLSVVFDEYHHVLHSAIKNSAEIVQRYGANRLVVL